MYKSYIVLLSFLVLLLAACSKDDGPAPLADGSITFAIAADKDTVQMPLSILADTVITIDVKAALSGNASATDHWISFAVDTSKLDAYRGQYGDAVLLPAESYFFYKPMARLAAGASQSEPGQVNIVLQTKLTEYTTYVLPVVIQSVDGKVEGPFTSRVLYYVLKTGKPLVISKTGWTIAGVSSVFSAFAAANVIDNNKTATYWASDITQSMPQWIAINLNRTVNFTALSYAVPPTLNYPTLGGYPTSIRIETSMDGTNWVDNGTYAGDISDNMQTINTGAISARYVRFTSLAAVKYASLYFTIFISDISLIP
ncbi:discoidin domain-containing protein [uncultured Chitinophaga sp.]|jgi:F5/8 type C domain.|uniref:discoidin domain-containing protein n=1 Tax=uncultured Chitinophaga sp. TaxID=339340 RepID=UPI0026217001|nr:discoidin domain-containing protein [uncultured Chitinophaga sp.]